jgi:ATP-dependent Clp protease ATP-binding subunit ClpB
VPLFIQVLDSTIQSFPKVSGGEAFQRCQQGSNRSRNYCKEMNDEFVSIEHLILALSISKVKFQILKIKALPKRIESSH